MSETGKLARPALVGVVMGSRSDWETMKLAAQTLEKLEIPFEKRVLSAHRTPDVLFDYAASAEARGLEVIIAGAGGAAHLPGMTAAKTILPVLGVPVSVISGCRRCGSSGSRSGTAAAAWSRCRRSSR